MSQYARLDLGETRTVPGHRTSFPVRTEESYSCCVFMVPGRHSLHQLPGTDLYTTQFLLFLLLELE